MNALLDDPLAVANVLIVDDNKGDVILTREALVDGKLNVKLEAASDGQDALNYLRSEAGRNPESIRPDVILLDLNMPRMDGHEFLATIKEDESLKTIPAVVLTTSDADEDILKSYKLQAACFVTKPVDFAQFQKIVNSLSNFWFTVVRLPGSA